MSETELNELVYFLDGIKHPGPTAAEAIRALRAEVAAERARRIKLEKELETASIRPLPDLAELAALREERDRLAGYFKRDQEELLRLENAERDLAQARADVDFNLECSLGWAKKYEEARALLARFRDIKPYTVEWTDLYRDLRAFLDPRRDEADAALKDYYSQQRVPTFEYPPGTFPARDEARGAPGVHIHFGPEDKRCDDARCTRGSARATPPDADGGEGS